MKRFRYLLILIVGILLGIFANRNREYLINAQFIRDHWHFRKPVDDQASVLKGDKVMVFLAFGQSNSANFGKGHYEVKHKDSVFNFYKGEIYPAKEPLLGPNGGGSSVWTRVADMVIDSGLYKKVLIVPCGIGSTSVQCWAEGDCRKKLESTIHYLKEAQIQPTHIFWFQGETDNVDKTSKEQYKTRLKEVIAMLRNNGINAPFYSSITSYCPFDNPNPFGISPAITAAQREVIAEVPNVRSGPNTDSLNLAYYRMEDMHFTEAGLDTLARKWFLKIRETEN